MSRSQTTLHPPALTYWRGLGAWNLYFLIKFLLAWTGALNLQLLPNLVFAAFLLMPLPPLWLHRLRHIVAIPIGIALLYNDTWFPPFSRLLEATDIWQFSSAYLLELAGRLINWEWVGAGLVLLVVYLFVSQWVRLTTFSVLGLAYLTLIGLPRPATTWDSMAAAAIPAAPVGVAAESPAPGVTINPQPPTSANLDRHLASFHEHETARRVRFQPLPAEAEPFDLLIVNICSLSWDDLASTGLREHPLFSKMDIMFEQFNSATSYSGPAAIRLLRASCGHTPHTDLYAAAPQECYLFENLGALGFAPGVSFNHNGVFQNFLKTVQDQGQLPAPASPANARRALVSFDGSPIWRDIDVLNDWWQRRQTSGTARNVTFYNTITLHDGNRYVNQAGGTQRAEYEPRAQILLDDLTAFIGELERSGRKVLIALVPEHGAGMHGDRMQIAGMREIPSPALTHVPVGLKLIGARDQRADGPIRISTPTSYLALAELVSRLSDGGAFVAEHIDWDTLVADLPATEPVAESDAVVVIQYQGAPYVRIKGQDWLPYPR